jgi:flavin-binding protein dodecin
VIGSSPESFAMAAQGAVEEAAKTVRGITGADVVSMTAVVAGDRMTDFRTTVDIAKRRRAVGGQAEVTHAPSAPDVSAEGAGRTPPTALSVTPESARVAHAIVLKVCR